MTRVREGRMLVERGIGRDGETLRGSRRRAVRSVTVNALESPLGWLFARRLVTRRQFDAGEQLRRDWERAALSSRITMQWDAAPVGRNRGGARAAPDLAGAQIDARRRFDGAVSAAGRGSQISCGAWFARARGCATPKRRSGGRARAGKLVLCLALDRVADFYRIR